MATLALIRRATIDKERWMTEEEFARDWALVQVVPGINLVGITILIGKRLAGWRGILICLAGMLLPSVAITILLTASYAQIQHHPLMQAALRGIIPATVGIGLVTTIQMAQPPLADARKEGVPLYLVAWVLMIGSGIAGLYIHGNIATILIGAALIGAIAQMVLPRKISNSAIEENNIEVEIENERQDEEEAGKP